MCLWQLILSSGGNDAAVVFPDVDIESVAEKVGLLAGQNKNQLC